LTTTILLSPASPLYAAFEGITGYGSDPLLCGADPDYFSRKQVRLTRINRFGLSELAINGCDISLPFGGARYSLNWNGSGDELYREQRIAAGYGMRHTTLPWIPSFTWNVTTDLYLIEMKRFDPRVAIGLSGNCAARLPGDIALLFFGDGLVTTDPDDGVAQTLSGRISWSLDSSNTLAVGVTDYSSNATGFTLFAESRFNRWITGRIAISDTPRSVGLGMELKVAPVAVTFTFSDVDPLGWNNSAAVTFRW